MSTQLCAVCLRSFVQHLKSGRAYDLVQNESGQDLIEYALLAALISLGAVTAIKGLATHVSTAFTSVSTSLTSAT